MGPCSVLPVDADVAADSVLDSGVAALADEETFAHSSISLAAQREASSESPSSCATAA